MWLRQGEQRGSQPVKARGKCIFPCPHPEIPGAKSCLAVMFPARRLAILVWVPCVHTVGDESCFSFVP